MAGETLELNFTIQNPNAGIKNCFIFGSNVTNRANLNQVTITPDFGVSYEQTLVDTQVGPFTIGEIRMQSDNIDQVNQSVNVLSQNIYGDTARKAIPIDFFEYQEFLQIIKIKKDIDITGLVGLLFSVLPRTTVICTVSIQKLIQLPIRFGNEFTSEHKGFITDYPIASDFKLLYK